MGRKKPETDRDWGDGLLSDVKAVSRFLRSYAAGTDDLALLVIDVQKEFCDPKGTRGNKETDEVSRRIAAQVPKFRAAGIPVYAIYFDGSRRKKPDQVDFFRYKVTKTDIPIAKNRDSAFSGSNIAKILKKNGHKNLLACGFNLSACVRDTINDARKAGFSVLLLRDLTGNDKYNTSDKSEKNKALTAFRKNRIDVTDSDLALAALQIANNNRMGPINDPGKVDREIRRLG